MFFTLIGIVPTVCLFASDCFSARPRSRLSAAPLGVCDRSRHCPGGAPLRQQLLFSARPRSRLSAALLGVCDRSRRRPGNAPLRQQLLCSARPRSRLSAALLGIRKTAPRTTMLIYKRGSFVKGFLARPDVFQYVLKWTRNTALTHFFFSGTTGTCKLAASTLRTPSRATPRSLSRSRPASRLPSNAGPVSVCLTVTALRSKSRSPSAAKNSGSEPDSAEMTDHESGLPPRGWARYGYLPEVKLQKRYLQADILF